MTSCPNCLNQFSGNYCNTCGQKKIEGRLTTKIVFADFVEDVFLFDSKLVKTIRDLIVKPAELVKSYLNGKHKSYFPPFKLFLFSLTTYLIVFHFFGDDMEAYKDSLIDFGAEVEYGAEELEEEALLTAILKKNLNIFFFLLIPILAFFISKFYRSLHYNYAEVLIFSIYIIGISLLISSLFMSLGQITPIFYTIITVFKLSYLVYAISRLTGSKSLLGLIKTFLVLVVSYLTLAIILAPPIAVYLDYLDEI